GTSTRTDPCGRLGILETAEVIRRAALFIGVESGPGHLANAVGTPGVVLTGHFSGYERYMPYSGAYADGTSADLIQWDGPAREIPVERVLAGATARLGEHATP
ncbi:MAG: glycosyltransferase family 9 protein, partial [Longimicrobiales bacterium]